MKIRKYTNLLGAAALALLAHSETRAEHDPDDGSGGIVMEWLLELGKAPASLKEPVIVLRLINFDDSVSYMGAIRTLEDHGSLQSRRVAEPFFVEIPAGGSVEVPIRFATKLPRELSHSGLVVAMLTACPFDQRSCTNGASEPIFFHPGTGGTLVYNERQLCERFGCGDLRRTGTAEPGTWRVLGGGPLHRVKVNEDPEEHGDERIVDGGES